MYQLLLTIKVIIIVIVMYQLLLTIKVIIAPVLKPVIFKEKNPVCFKS